MKTTHNIRKNFISYSLAVILASASIVSVASPQSEGVFRTDSGVSYISGGVGDESMARLDSIAGDFNLKLIFAMKSGEYVSNVRVSIIDAAGRTVLDTTTEGPWLLAKLSADTYQVIANFAGKTDKHPIVVGDTKLKTVDFRWTTE